jgi:hypothetical protein
MAKKKRNPNKRTYNQHLKKTNIPPSQGGPTYAFEEELSKRKRNKFLIAGVAAVSIIMVVSLILPYLGGSNGQWQPTGIRNEENTAETYNPSSIITNQAFNRRENDYLVLVGTQTNIEEAKGDNTSKLATYYIDSDEAVNHEVKTNLPVIKPMRPNEIGTKDLLVLRVKGHKVILGIQGKDKVLNYLQKLK